MNEPTNDFFSFFMFQFRVYLFVHTWPQILRLNKIKKVERRERERRKKNKQGGAAYIWGGFGPAFTHDHLKKKKIQQVK